jgi:PilZ domain-containing protein
MMTEPIPAPKVLGEIDSRRKEQRAECYLEVAISNAQRAFLPAIVLDLSVGGLKLLVDPPPAPRDVLRLTFMIENGRLFQMKATVIHYIEHGDNWAVGCQFARELEEKELEALF